MEIGSIISETTGNELFSDAHGNKETSDDDDENLIIRRTKLTKKFSECESETNEENVDKAHSPRHNSQSASSDEETMSKRKNSFRKEMDSIISDTALNEVFSDAHSNKEISDDDDENLIIRRKKLTQSFSDPETDEENVDKTQIHIVNEDISTRHSSQSASSDEETKSKAKPKNRIRKMSSSDDNSDSDSSNNKLEMKVRQGNRIKQKRNNMKNKFDNLLSTRNKSIECTQNDAHSDSNLNSSDKSNVFKEENNQRHIIDQSIYDKDISDDEINDISEIKKKVKYKSTKMISPKPFKTVRMSAKQAMDNMHKIKSESNRMLREKEVSLPYHRPKAFTLKDVKNWKKPAVTKDGKALPLKMNEEQLKQYALLLEQRQKEIVELCKSDSEDDENKEEIKSTLIENKSSKHEQECSNNLLCDENNVMGPHIINHNEDDGIDENQTKNNSEETCLDMRNDDRQTNTLTKSDVSHVTEDKSVNQENYLDYNDEENQSNTRTETDSMYTENITLQLSPETNVYNEDSSNVVCENASDFSNDVINYDLQITNMGTKKDDLDDMRSLDDDTKNYSYEMKLSLSDEDIDMEEIDKLIENADIIKDKSISNLNSNPKISGSPGMVINLDNDDVHDKHQRLSGVELLKDRFVYFAQMQTPKDLERSKEHRIKPGAQHLKLKLDLEHEIAQRRSIEWAKRLEEEKQKQLELKEIRGDISQDEDDLEKIEAKLAEEEAIDEVAENDNVESETEQEELIENDIDMTDKKKKHNPLVEDEAEESDVDDTENVDNTEMDDEGGHIDSDMESFESEDETSDEDTCAETNVRKGRILKAFEDSDDEDTVKITQTENSEVKNTDTDKAQDSECINDNIKDDELYSAQLHHSISEDIFTSQELAPKKNCKDLEKVNDVSENKKTAPNDTILDNNECVQTLNKDSLGDMSVISEPQTNEEGNFDDVVNMCSGTFSQNLVTSSQDIPIDKESQEIGDDMLSLCTGKFYDNEFVKNQIPPEQIVKENPPMDNKTDITNDNTILKSILDELDGPEYNEVQPKKFFVSDNETGKIESDQNHDNTQFKKRFVIESDDDCINDEKIINKKKIKRKRREKRALQISDDEMDEDPCEGDEDLDDDHVSSDDEQDSDNRIVEYDSEENEVEVQQPKKKTKRKTTEFFEQEAELTSEDEWVGSGDEDEAGLDRMEREEGDNDHFHQGRLHRELEQIHMREVMDQDKREVRLIQEVLFEDADLGDGHRQRQFRWRNMDGAIENGEVNLEMDSQEREDESEEQWRKERHERETYVRQLMKENEEKEQANLIINTKVTTTVVVEKKNSAKDIPSPAKKPFSILQQQFRGSLLSRGGGMLTRLAALAAPLARDAADLPTAPLQPANTRNFVFAAVSPKPDGVKVIKRKAEVINTGTPKLIKKMKTQEKVQTRRSIFDHLQD